MKILAFAASARKGSFNKKLIAVAASTAKRLGAEVTLIDLRDFPLPLYDGDLEEEKGIPENAIKLRDLMLAHQGIMISSPEYNGSISPLFKNTIDWISRDETDAFEGKAFALFSASPGGLGGIRALPQVRHVLTVLGTLVIPEQLALARAADAFNDDGSLKDPKQNAAVEKVVAAFVQLLKKLSS